MAATGEPQQLYLRTKRTPVMSDSTFRGRINIGLNYLKSHFPEKQIVLLTPIHRAYAKFSDDNVQPDERYQNKCGAYIDDYVQAVKEAANVWSVPVIDLNAVSGLNPMRSICRCSVIPASIACIPTARGMSASHAPSTIN